MTAAPPPTGYPPPAGYPLPPVWYPPASPPSALPVVPREYHEFYRTPRLKWWHPLAAIGFFLGVWLVVNLLVSLPIVLYDLSTGTTISELADGTVTPALFLGNNIILAAAIGVAVGAQGLVFRQRPGWIFSIQGKFRWGLLGRFMLCCLPFYAVAMALYLVAGGVPELSIRPETWFLLASVILTTPLQCAGEEAAFRGIFARSIGSWFGSRRVGLVVATAITAVAFMFVHNAGDPWLNANYLVFAVTASVLVWKTGGLEAPIALHVVNNLAGLLFVPFVGLDGLFDREAGVGSPINLIDTAVVLGAAATILWQARKLGTPTSAAPAAATGTVVAEGPQPHGAASQDRG